MSKRGRFHRRWTLSFVSRAVAGLVLFSLAAACNSATAPPTAPRPEQPRPEPPRNWPDVSGTYTLTVSASGRCASELPETARTRTFTATIAQTGGALVVTVPMSVWEGWFNRFRGGFTETDNVVLQLSIEDWGPLEPTVFEEFYASGLLTATMSAGGLSGFLNGDIAVQLPRSPYVASCTAPDHRAVFSR